MIHPDLLICWIKHCDYPIFRRFLKRHREFFGKVIIYWSEHFREMYYDKFIQEDLQGFNIQFLQNIEYKYGVEDWRNVATNYMLKESNSEWVCSVEQDFFVKNWDKLFAEIVETSKSYDFLGYKGYQGQAGQEHQSYLTGNYVHPSFWFIKRSTLEKTSKDFSAIPERGADHFGLITQDAERLKIPIWYTQEHGFDETEAFHQGGININYLESQKEGYIFHRPELFCLYNYWSMKVFPQNPQFLELCKKVDSQLKFTQVNPETDERNIYYK